MGLFSSFFAMKKEQSAPAEQPKEFSALLQIKRKMNSLLEADRYIAKSEYLDLKDQISNIEFFEVLLSSETIDAYCKKNRLDTWKIRETVSLYRDFSNLVEAHNNAFLEDHLTKDKEYLDNILKAVDPKVLLDNDQRKVVLSDEDYTLVIAGAGAGKTTTVAAKVKYLVEKKQVDPKKILVVSFTNKAVGELREKINRDLGIDCPVATFHSTGNAIIHKNNPEKLNIVDDSKLYFVIQDYFRNDVLKNEGMVNNLILFFASYFDAPYEGKDLNDFFNNLAKANFSTMRSDLYDFERQIVDSRTKKAVTIQSEVMRSHQEVEIANFLYLHNLEYDYEPLYRYDILMARKPYTPDFLIRQGDKVVYLEHFGITEDGKNNLYSDKDLKIYKKAINDKIHLHRQHGTQLIYTFSQYKDGRPLIEHLQKELEDAGFVLTPRPNKEVLEKLVTTEENRYIRKLVTLICRFISNFKTNGYTAEEFDRMYHSTSNVRSRLFLNICNECYLEYDRYLKANDALDFQDMINESARILREAREMKQKLDFEYIFVDEYQDISKQRFDLVTALHEATDAKIIAVGDDWQSIYAFSGSDISLFTKFEEKMGYAKLLKIVKTYRNSQEVIDIAGNFIQKNDAQIKKDLVSPKKIQDPVIIYTYDARRKKDGDDRLSGANFAMAQAVEAALDQIVFFSKSEGKPVGSVLLLGRYGFDGDLLERSGLFEYISLRNKVKSVKYPKIDITFMTVHASKGLGYDNVILVNCKNETFGFPSKIEDDPVLAFVIKGDRSIDYAEERRLFYVAMTRTKNRVYMIAPEQNPSEFLLEIKHDYKNVVLKGEWNESPPQNLSNRKSCPLCGYPMQFRYKPSYGLRLNICTNDPEVCGFMTNEVKAGKLSIMKCDKCRDGYLIVKPAQNGRYFLGCTNYKKDKTGCGNILWQEDYYKMNGYEPDFEQFQTEKATAYSPKKQTQNEKPLEMKKKAPIGAIRTEKKYPEPAPEVLLKVAEDARQFALNTSDPHTLQSEKTGCQTEAVEIKKAVLSKEFSYQNHDLNDAIFTVLNCLEHISEKYFYGLTVLTDVLHGSRQKKIVDRKLDEIPEFSDMLDWKTEDICSLIGWMIQNNFILQTKALYPVLHPTYEGRHYSEVITTGQLQKLQEYLEKRE